MNLLEELKANNYAIIASNGYYSYEDGIKPLIGKINENIQERKFYDYLKQYSENGKYIIDTKIDIKDSCVGLSALVTFIGLYLGIIFLIIPELVNVIKEMIAYLPQLVENTNANKRHTHMGGVFADFLKIVVNFVFMMFVFLVTI